MRPIPQKHRKLINSDPYFKKSCLSNIPKQSGNPIVIHHAWTYAGKQINEMWNYCPLLDSEHSPYSTKPSAHNSKYINDKVKLIAIRKVDLEYLKANFPKKNWELEINKIKFNLDSNSALYEQNKKNMKKTVKIMSTIGTFIGLLSIIGSFGDPEWFYSLVGGLLFLSWGICSLIFIDSLDNKKTKKSKK